MCCEGRFRARRPCSLRPPAFLWGAAPEGFQAVVIASLLSEDVDDHVGEVEADPGASLLYALCARTVAVVDHPLYDFFGHAPGLAFGLGAGYHEVVRVRDESSKVHHGDGFSEHLARGSSRRGGHLVTQRLALRFEALPDGGFVASHDALPLKRSPLFRSPSPLYNLLSPIMSCTPSGTR